jgi:hypothetical protein
MSSKYEDEPHDSEQSTKVVEAVAEMLAEMRHWGASGQVVQLRDVLEALATAAEYERQAFLGPRGLFSTSDRYRTIAKQQLSLAKDLAAKMTY